EHALLLVRGVERDRRLLRTVDAAQVDLHLDAALLAGTDGDRRHLLLLLDAVDRLGAVERVGTRLVLDRVDPVADDHPRLRAGAARVDAADLVRLLAGVLELELALRRLALQERAEVDRLLLDPARGLGA